MPRLPRAAEALRLPRAAEALRLPRAAEALILAGCAIMAVYWAAAIGCPAAFDYAEGDTASWIWLLRHGADVYHLGLLSTNYPPTQLRLVAALAPSDAAILPVGRLVALAGFLLAAAMVALSVVRATRSRRLGLFAALLLMATLTAGYHATVCRADTLALGLGCVGVALVALRAPGWPVLAAIAFCASLLTKHNLIVLPGGVCAWALVREPRRGLLMGAMLGGLLALGLFRLGLWQPLIAWSIAGWEPLVLLRYLAQSVAPLGFGVALGLWALPRLGRLPDEARRVCEPWAVVLLAGIGWWVALGRTGSSSNYLLEMIAALAVLIPVAAVHGAPRWLLYAHLSLALVETTVWVSVLVASVLPGSRRELEAVRRALAGTSGPVFAEKSWHATIAGGRAPVAIPYLAAQLGRAHRWDATPLLAQLRAGSVERVLLGFSLEGGGGTDVMHRDRFLAEELAALRARYRLLERDGELFVYAPR